MIQNGNELLVKKDFSIVAISWKGVTSEIKKPSIFLCVTTVFNIDIVPEFSIQTYKSASIFLCIFQIV